MTVTAANGHPTAVTDGHLNPDVRVRVRRPENPPHTPGTPGSGRKSVYTRAIPRLRVVRPLLDARDAISLHVTDAADAVASGWAATEQPQPLSVTWRQVLPADGEATSRSNALALTAGGLLRALWHTAAYMLIRATDTRTKAAVMTLIAALTTLTVYTAAQLAG